VLAVVALILVALMCRPARSADTTITFDDLPPNTPVIAQYHKLGVDFGLPPYASLPPTSKVPTVSCCIPITRTAPSGYSSQVASISWSSNEFYNPGLFGTFSTFRHYIQISIGNSLPGDTTPVTLSAFSVSGDLLAQTAGSVSGGSEPITLRVVARGSTATIAYFLVQSSAYNKQLWVDNLTFDNPAAGAPPDFAFNLQGLVWAGSAIFLTQGGSATVTLPLVRFNGSYGGISLSAIGLPRGVRASFAPTVIPDAGTSTSLTLAAGASAPVATSIPFVVQGVPANITVGPAPRSAQLRMSITSPATISVSGTGYTFPSCTDGTIGPIYVNKNPSAIPSDVTLSLRVSDGNGTTSDLPAGIHTNFTPAVSSLAKPFTTHSLTVSIDGGTLQAGQLLNVVVVGTSGNLTFLSQPFTLRGHADGIDRITPATASIPNQTLHIPGTTVTITGTGFCPGSTVEFGNAKATPSPTSLSSTQIVVSVPPLATVPNPPSSPISIIRTDGSILVAGASTPFFVDSVRNTGGYSFHNYVPHTTFDELTSAYGPNQTEDQIPLCWPFDCTISVNDPNAIVWLNIFKSFTDSQGGGGACFGIALSSARFRAQPYALQNYPYSQTLPLNVFSLSAQAGPSPPLTSYINSQDLVQFSMEYAGEYLRQSLANSTGHTDDVLLLIHNAIHYSLASGELPMIALRWGGFSGHLVTAYDIEDVSTNPIEYYIDVYDPNGPFTDGENLDTTGATHSANVQQSRILVMPDGTWGLQGSTKNATGFISGFVVTPASTITLNPTLPGSWAASAGNSAGTTFFGSVGGDGRSAAPLASRTIQVADDAGRVLFGVDGKVNADPTTRLNATPYPLFDRREGTGEMFVLGAGSGPIAQTIVGARTGSDRHFFASKALFAQVESTSSPGVQDRVRFDPSGAVSFTTRGEEKSLTISLSSQSKGLTRSVDMTMTATRDAVNELSFDSSGTGVVLRHHGPASTVNLRLSTLATEGGPVTFESEPLKIGPDQTAMFEPLDWRRLDTIDMETVGSAGQQSKVVLKNRAFVGESDATIVDVDVEPTVNKPRTSSIQVTSKITAVRPDDQIAITWIVRHDNVIVGHEVRLLKLAKDNVGTRHDSFDFTAPRIGPYDVHVEIVVRAVDGVISRVRRSSKNISFNIK
jgi:hypothetical protein